MRTTRVQAKIKRSAARAALSAIALLALALSSAVSALAAGGFEYYDIYVGPQKVFFVTNTNIMSAVERGEEVNERIRKLLADPDVDPNQIQIRTGLDNVPVIMLGNLAVCRITPEDAEAAGKPMQAVATEWLNRLKTELTQQKAAALKEAGVAPEATTTGEPGAHPKKHGQSDSSTLGEHAVLLLFIEIAILLFASLLFGELAVRLGQPAIIGQITAGLILGQTVFGSLFPDLSAVVFPQDNLQSKLIAVVSWIGVSFLLMLTGMETDIAMLKKLGKPALYIGVLGLVVPIIAGALFSLALPASLMGDPDKRAAFAVFMGTVFAISSVPVVAKILMEMKLLKNEIGQLVLAASLTHDLLCCLMLAVIAVLAGGGEGGNPILTASIGTVCFALVMYFGRPVYFGLLGWVNDKVSTKQGLITASSVFLLACAAATQALGIHIVLGACAAGLILSQTPVINHKVVQPLETVTMGFFAPIFFASAGLNVNLTSLLKPELAIVTVLMTLASVASKLAACVWAGRLAKLGTWESLSVAIGSNTKGSMGLIIAILGYSLHIINTDMYGIVIFVSLFSTAIAPALMKWTMSKVVITEEEKERLAKEERRSRTVLSSVRRVLWPTSGRASNQFIAALLNSIGRQQVLETVLFWVNSPGHFRKDPFVNVKHALDRKHVSVVKRKVKSENPIDAIADEANKGYDLLVMATEDPAADVNHVFGELVDQVILKSSTRVLVVYEPEKKEKREIKKVLVPVSGTELSVTAGEFGISLAKSLGAKVTCLCITESEAQDLYSEKTRSGEQIQRNITSEIEGTLAELSNALDVDFHAVLVQSASHPAQAIILKAQQDDADLIVLGAEPKLGKHLFFGHTINFILRNAPCAVAVLRSKG